MSNPLLDLAHDMKEYPLWFIRQMNSSGELKEPPLFKVLREEYGIALDKFSALCGNSHTIWYSVNWTAFGAVEWRVLAQLSSEGKWIIGG